MSADLTKSLPYSPDAETAILQHCFYCPADVGEVLLQIPDGAFYHPGNRLLYESIGHMVGEGVPIEHLSASNWLTEQGLIDKVGGIGELAEVSGSVGAANWRYYRDILMDKWKAREIISMATEAIQQAYQQPAEGTVDDWIGNLTERILALSIDRQQKRLRTFEQLMGAAVDRYEESSKRGGALPGLATGFPGLDHITGGKQPGQLWVIGGGTSDGKSAYAQQTALFIASQGHPVGLYTLEMPDDEVVDRFFAMHAKIPSDLFKRGIERRDHWTQLTRSFGEMRHYPLHIRDVSGIKLSPLVADMRLLAKRGVKHFVVDYGQLIESEGKSRSREEEVARISRTMKATAKQLRVSIDLLSQLNDDGKLRESRAIGFDADVVATLSCPISKEKKDGEWIETRQEEKRILFVGKNRNGKRSVAFPMRFDGPTFTFTEEANKP